MTTDIFYAARNHDAGPGEWCIRSKRCHDWQVISCGRMQSNIMAHILNNIERYPEMRDFGIDNIIWTEEYAFENKKKLLIDDGVKHKTIEECYKDILDVGIPYEDVKCD